MIIIGSIISTWLILRLTLPFFKKYFLAKQEKRSIHQLITPQGGGIIFALVSSYFSYQAGSFIPSICLLLAFLGLFDDKFKLPIFVRYLVQFFVLILLMYYQNIFDKIFFSNLNLNLILYFLIIISGTAFINLTNFMDGIDGLVSSSFILILIFISSFTYPELIIISSTLMGFLPWNINPAKIFMGDAGSTFLGIIYVSALFSCKSYTQMLYALFIAAPLLGDALFCIIRRAIYKQNIFKAHKLHLYQRLYLSGMSQQKITMLYCLAICLVGFSTFFSDLRITIVVILLELILAVWLDRKIALPFDIALRSELH